jgi:hypothetical protein
MLGICVAFVAFERARPSEPLRPTTKFALVAVLLPWNAIRFQWSMVVSESSIRIKSGTGFFPIII